MSLNRQKDTQSSRLNTPSGNEPVGLGELPCNQSLESGFVGTEGGAIIAPIFQYGENP